MIKGQAPTTSGFAAKFCAGTLLLLRGARERDVNAAIIRRG
jgi:hypothetical protein